MSRHIITKVAALEQPHPPTPFLELGTATNDAIAKLKSIYLSPRDKPSQKASGLDVSVPRVLNETPNQLRTILE
jgi:hypothetical protein